MVEKRYKVYDKKWIYFKTLDDAHDYIVRVENETGILLEAVINNSYES